MTNIISYIAVLVPMLVLDMVWILGIAKSFYSEKMGFLFTQSPNMMPAVFFYIIYAVAVLVLSVTPSVSNSSWVEALWKGALLGLAAYGAYDLTNHTTIANWPLSMTILDMAWGMTVTALTSVIAYFVITNIK